ncbi:hypothetical protein L1887_55812 [Cichorium endivia]|nr:hypothetical protein L1887_55812 [Cichorium endivia]
MPTAAAQSPDLEPGPRRHGRVRLGADAIQTLHARRAAREVRHGARAVRGRRGRRRLRRVVRVGADASGKWLVKAAAQREVGRAGRLLEDALGVLELRRTRARTLDALGPVTQAVGLKLVARVIATQAAGGRHAIEIWGGASETIGSAPAWPLTASARCASGSAYVGFEAGGSVRGDGADAAATAAAKLLAPATLGLEALLLLFDHLLAVFARLARPRLGLLALAGGSRLGLGLGPASGADAGARRTRRASCQRLATRALSSSTVACVMEAGCGDALFALGRLFGLGVERRVVRGDGHGAKGVAVEAVATFLVLVEHVGEAHERVSASELAEVAHLAQHDGSARDGGGDGDVVGGRVELAVEDAALAVVVVGERRPCASARGDGGGGGAGQSGAVVGRARGRGGARLIRWRQLVSPDELGSPPSSRPGMPLGRRRVLGCEAP